MGIGIATGSPQLAVAQSMFCQKGHVLQLSRDNSLPGYASGWRCDFCQVLGPSVLARYFCKVCQYDVCPDCYKQKTTVAPVEVPVKRAVAPVLPSAVQTDNSAAQVEMKAIDTMLSGRKPLTLSAKGTSTQLILTELSISVLVVAKLVETTFDMTWRNPTDDDVEGELQFPLEEGATVCAYAVDIDGAMVPGVIVGKEKARAVFEEEVRENKSAPAIAEQVAGNMFQTRVHPFRAHHVRRVRVSYATRLVDLQSAADAAQAALWACAFAAPHNALTRLSIGVDVCLPSESRAALPRLLLATGVCEQPMLFSAVDSDRFVAEYSRTVTPSLIANSDSSADSFQLPALPWLAVSIASRTDAPRISVEAEPMLIDTMSNDSSNNGDGDDDDASDNEGSDGAKTIAIDDATMRFVYFSISESVTEPNNAATTTAMRTDTITTSNFHDETPTIALLFDKSFSRRIIAAADAEQSYLNALLHALPDSATCDVYIIRQCCDEPRSFGGKNEKLKRWRAALVEYVNSEPCDGATLLVDDQTSSSSSSSLLLRDRSPLSGVSYTWRALFSDGLATLGDALPRQSPSRSPLHTLCGSADADYAVLRALADRSGGQSCNLTSAACVSKERLVELVCGDKAPFRYLRSSVTSSVPGLSFDGTADVVNADVDHESTTTTNANVRRIEIFPQQPTVVASGGAPFELVGRLAIPRTWTPTDTESDVVRVSVHFGRALASVTRVHSIRIADALRRADASATSARGLLARHWAQSLLSHLSATLGSSAALPAMQLAIGRRFGIVTANASLIVLDKLEQYLKHDIAPPSSLAKLAAAYARRIGARRARARRLRDEQARDIDALWQRRVGWWNAAAGLTASNDEHGQQQQRDKQHTLVIEHSLPPRIDVSAQLANSSVGSELVDSAAEQRWRHAQSFVGFDDLAIGHVSEESSVDIEARDDEFDTADTSSADSLFVRELARAAQFTGTTFDLYQTYGDGWYPDELQLTVRELLFARASGDHAPLPDALCDRLARAFKAQCAALQKAARTLDMRVSSAVADATIAESQINVQMLRARRAAVSRELSRAVGAATRVVERASAVGDVSSTQAESNLLKCAADLHRMHAACAAGDSEARFALARAQRCDDALRDVERRQRLETTSHETHDVIDLPTPNNSDFSINNVESLDYATMPLMTWIPPMVGIKKELRKDDEDEDDTMPAFDVFADEFQSTPVPTVKLSSQRNAAVSDIPVITTKVAAVVANQTPKEQSVSNQPAMPAPMADKKQQRQAVGGRKESKPRRVAVVSVDDDGDAGDDGDDGIDTKQLDERSKAVGHIERSVREAQTMFKDLNRVVQEQSTQLDVLQSTKASNIAPMLSRGEKMEYLSQKSEDLSAASQMFKRSSSTLNNSIPTIGFNVETASVTVPLKRTLAAGSAAGSAVASVVAAPFAFVGGLFARKAKRSAMTSTNPLYDNSDAGQTNSLFAGSSSSSSSGIALSTIGASALAERAQRATLSANMPVGSLESFRGKPAPVAASVAADVSSPMRNAYRSTAPSSTFSYAFSNTIGGILDVNATAPNKQYDGGAVEQSPAQSSRSSSSVVRTRVTAERHHGKQHGGLVSDAESVDGKSIANIDAIESNVTSADAAVELQRVNADVTRRHAKQSAGCCGGGSSALSSSSSSSSAAYARSLIDDDRMRASMHLAEQQRLASEQQTKQRQVDDDRKRKERAEARMGKEAAEREAKAQADEKARVERERVEGELAYRERALAAERATRAEQERARNDAQQRAAAAEYQSTAQRTADDVARRVTAAAQAAGDAVRAAVERNAQLRHAAAVVETTASTDTHRARVLRVTLAPASALLTSAVSATAAGRVKGARDAVRLAIESVRKESDVEKAYAQYLASRSDAPEFVGFYVAVSDHFIGLGSANESNKSRCNALAARVLSTLCELRLAEPQLYRLLGYRLEQLDMLDTSVLALARARTLRRSEPNAWRDEALARLRRQRRGDWRHAVRLLMRVVRGGWHARFAQIELVAGMDLAHALSHAPGGRAALIASSSAALSTSAVRLANAARHWRLLPCELRVVARWDVDDCDVELQILERQSNVRCTGLINATPSGAMLSRNITCGLGPQEFLACTVPRGGFELSVRLHQRTARTLSDCVTVILNIYTHWGSANECERVVCVRLSSEPVRDSSAACWVGSVDAVDTSK